jgi:hypothetical protein
MTPSPEKKKILKKFNKKMMGSNVERTVEKYSQSQLYGRERNGSEYDGREEGEEEEKGGGEEDEDGEGDSGEEEDGEDEEGEGEGDSDDECSIGELNLSNHDINDDDEVLQSVPDYHTPENKNKNRKHISNTNSSKISTTNTTKTPQKNVKMNGRVSSPFLTGRALTPTPESKTYLQQNLSNKIGAKGVHRMAKLPIKKRNDMTRIPDRVKNACAVAVPGIGLGGGTGTGTGIGRLGGECRFMGGVRDEEMSEITAQIRTLNAELKYFEELTGKRCIFETSVSRDRRVSDERRGREKRRKEGR